MLEANPELTWRDVQHLVVRTADRVDFRDSGWHQTAAGYWHNHKYGFGRLLVDKLVGQAEDMVHDPKLRAGPWLKHSLPVHTVNRQVDPRSPITEVLPVAVGSQPVRR